MRIQGKQVDLPAKGELRFDSLIDSLNAQAKQAQGAERAYLEDLLERSKILDQKEGVSPAMLKEHKILIDELIRIISPVALTKNEIKAISAPWNLELIHISDRFQGILNRAGKDYSLSYGSFDDDQMYLAACTFIMAIHYGFPGPKFKPFYFQIPNTETGVLHSYRLASNVDNVKIEPTERSIEITQDIYNELIDNFTDLALWKKYFPVDSWIFSGFNIINLMDLTADQMHADMVTHLLSGNTSQQWGLKQDISGILGTPILLSFLSIKGDHLVKSKGRDITDMVLGSNDLAPCRDVMCRHMQSVLMKQREHLAIPNVEAYAKEHNCKSMAQMAKSGIQSYYAAPVLYQGEMFGIMELGSTQKGALNASKRIQIEDLLPIISISGKRFLDEQENRVEAIIQSEFTTIHPSVKWRFEEEANKIITAGYRLEEYEIERIVFQDVYPLFGQLDIRSSSVIRNEGIQKDLQTQLKGARKVIAQAFKKNEMPLYEELIFVLDSHYDLLETDMVSASEQDILQFISSEVHPILEHLASIDPKTAKIYAEYQALLHPGHGFVYRERALFDTAVNTVNKVLSRYLDSKQSEAQAMFPHHFERYATDGLEFNMYIGDSISPGLGFHPIMIKNLRLWQLIVMIEMEREYNEVKKTLEKQLNVAALILAHSTPLAIQYRMDEKQFDVEGAYNARYEIVKKRIDKAHIKGTNERITEPGMMVVVYSTDSDEREYLRYFKYLQSKGYLLKQKPEFLTLEDLQGVSGLKALRLGIDYQDADISSELSIEEIIQEIEGKAAKENA